MRHNDFLAPANAPDIVPESSIHGAESEASTDVYSSRNFTARHRALEQVQECAQTDNHLRQQQTMEALWMRDDKRRQRDGESTNWQALIGRLALPLSSLLVGGVVGFFVGRNGGGAEDAGESGAGAVGGGGKRASSRGAAMLRMKAGATGEPIPRSPSSQVSAPDSKSAAPADGSELKMVLVVRQDLKMSAGKAAAQCAHAAVGIFSQLSSRNRLLFQRYEECGQPKIVVQCKNQKELEELRGRAQGAGLPTYTVTDAGRTQVAAGSKTVLAIGPGSKPVVDNITRHLRLL